MLFYPTAPGSKNYLVLNGKLTTYGKRFLKLLNLKKGGNR